MPAFLEPVRGYALRVGRETTEYGKPFGASGIVNWNIERMRWEIIAFTRRSDDDYPKMAIHRDTVAACRVVGIREYCWERIREDGSEHWVKVRT